MRVHPVLLPDLTEGETSVAGDEAHHLIRVLRVRPGATLRAFDGRGREACAEVVRVEAGRLTLQVAAPSPGRREPQRQLTLLVALPKGDKLSDVVRMTTELGVARIRTLLSRRCEVAPPSSTRLERLERVAREAAKQSGRSVVPPIDPPVPLERVGPPESGVDGVVAHPGSGRRLAQVAAGLGRSVALVTGPEGGFDPDEVESLARAGWCPVDLGPRILRAETAPVAGAALILLEGGA